METIIICDGIQINRYDSRNTFGRAIPVIGDKIRIGETVYDESNKAVTYKVIDRIFSAVETYNHIYTNQKITLIVEEVK